MIGPVRGIGDDRLDELPNEFPRVLVALDELRLTPYGESNHERGCRFVRKGGVQHDVVDRHERRLLERDANDATCPRHLADARAGEHVREELDGDLALEGDAPAAGRVGARACRPGAVRWR